MKHCELTSDNNSPTTSEPTDETVETERWESESAAINRCLMTTEN